jgi:probable rRNA maturation factor
MTPTVDITTAAAAWTRALPSAARVVRKAAHAAWAAGARARDKRRANASTFEISILLTSDVAVRTLNAAYRGIDKPTNVLSFPAGESAAGDVVLLGDVVIAYQTVAREAKEARKSLKDHLSHMVVHGVLHLLGYDHEIASDAKKMERLETEILAAFGMSDPYRADGAPAAPRVRRTAAPAKTARRGAKGPRP